MLKMQLAERNVLKELSPVVLVAPILVLLCAVFLAVAIGIVDPLYGVGVVGALFVTIALINRQNELLVLLVVIIKVYVDFYLGYAFVAQILTLVLLGAYFLRRSPSLLWVSPPFLWLWLVLLITSILPALHGVSALDSAYYYFNVILFPFIIFWLGVVIARSNISVHRVFAMIAAFGTCIGGITIFQSVSGVLLFKSDRYDSALALLSNYQLGTSGVSRAGAYLINPDSNGGFLGLILLLAIGLLAVSRSLMEKIIYGLEIVLLSFALLSTYTTSAWVGVLVGLITFFIFVGHSNYRIQFLSVVLVSALVLLVFFPTQVNLQLQHAVNPSETSLRLAAWRTGIQVIRALPLTGLGMGRYVYFERADPYRVFEQYIPLDHPHNSFLELASLGGIQVAVVFALLILLTLWRSFKKWTKGSAQTRTLLATGMAVVIGLTAYSMANAGWTFVPLAVIGWLMLGCISSPLWQEVGDERRVTEAQ